jgi:hypothetical protein
VTTLEQLRALVAEQMRIIAHPGRRDALQRLLVSPRREDREWDYGTPGERYPYWVVAESVERGILLVYCEQGFGPGIPWGFLFTRDPKNTTMGMDSQWNWYLEEAFVRSGLWPDGICDGDAILLPPEQRFHRTAVNAQSGPAHEPPPRAAAGDSTVGGGEGR